MSLVGGVRLLLVARTVARPRVVVAESVLPPIREGAWARSRREAVDVDESDSAEEHCLATFAVQPVLERRERFRPAHASQRLGNH
jgi:hypothetical protein